MNNNVVFKPCEFGETPYGTIPSEALNRERVTTIPKGSTLKRVEAQGNLKVEDIV